MESSAIKLRWLVNRGIEMELSPLLLDKLKLQKASKKQAIFQTIAQVRKVAGKKKADLKGAHNKRKPDVKLPPIKPLKTKRIMVNKSIANNKRKLNVKLPPIKALKTKRIMVKKSVANNKRKLNVKLPPIKPLKTKRIMIKKSVANNNRIRKAQIEEAKKKIGPVIVKAIQKLDDKNGSSMRDINRYLKQERGLDVKARHLDIMAVMRNAIKTGIIHVNDGKYRMAAKRRKSRQPKKIKNVRIVKKRRRTSGRKKTTRRTTRKRPKKPTVTRKRRSRRRPT